MGEIFLDNAGRLSESDYYRRNQEFQVWLTEEHKIRFSDLPTRQQQKKYFRKFITKWNSGELNGMRI